MKYINTCRCIVIMIYRSTTSHTLQDFSHGRKPYNWWTDNIFKDPRDVKANQVSMRRNYWRTKSWKGRSSKRSCLGINFRLPRDQIHKFGLNNFLKSVVEVHGGGVHQRTWSMFIAKHNAFVSTKRPGPCEAKLENELVHKKFLFIYSRVFLL